MKEDYALVRTGPYVLVRHPIYTGLLVAVIGSAIARADFAALLAIACAPFSINRRVDIEERRMSETFGKTYARYRLETPSACAVYPIGRAGLFIGIFRAASSLAFIRKSSSLFSSVRNPRSGSVMGSMSAAVQSRSLSDNSMTDGWM